MQSLQKVKTISTAVNLFVKCEYYTALILYFVREKTFWLCIIRKNCRQIEGFRYQTTFHPLCLITAWQNYSTQLYQQFRKQHFKNTFAGENLWEKIKGTSSKDGQTSVLRFDLIYLRINTRKTPCNLKNPSDVFDIKKIFLKIQKLFETVEKKSDLPVSQFKNVL